MNPDRYPVVPRARSRLCSVTSTCRSSAMPRGWWARRSQPAAWPPSSSMRSGASLWPRPGAYRPTGRRARCSRCWGSVGHDNDHAVPGGRPGVHRRVCSAPLARRNFGLAYIVLGWISGWLTVVTTVGLTRSMSRVDAGALMALGTCGLLLGVAYWWLVARQPAPSADPAPPATVQSVDPAF